MASATKLIYLSMILLLLQLTPLMESIRTNPTLTPTPTEWPLQFHSVLFINNSGSLQKTDLWYDWPNGRNFNIIQNQLGELKYDLEWNNGTSFIYTLEPFNKTCKVLHFDVGILRPNWLQGATFLGQERVDNFLCNVWEKVEFIVYYEDVITHRPVKWIFYTGMTAHVMTFEVGAVLEDAKWQAPVYCFGEAETENQRSKISPVLESPVHGGSPGMLIRTIADAADAVL
ncbi:hypothetical protein TanjilG_06313 [Lupinus angustifolius]|uniref:Transferring glycosyl group transferase n=1 Tax=Lupinus angustifolius TaxID=3871 RepID=A0A1J7IHN1_LUPAN|nr:PREDICTED: uncharacterized protein At4g14100-like [Lupinus angustifolius]OIW18229.1 hypothetical protein TanjilG_06313 [Lupinus angustifolius]